MMMRMVMLGRSSGDDRSSTTKSLDIAKKDPTITFAIIICKLESRALSTVISLSSRRTPTSSALLESKLMMDETLTDWTPNEFFGEFQN